jgi:hypothetical protein
LYVDWFEKYFTNGFNGPLRGFLLDHLMLQDIVDVAPDGLSAKGRFRCVLQGGCHESMRDPIANFPKQFHGRRAFTRMPTSRRTVSGRSAF